MYLNYWYINKTNGFGDETLEVKVIAIYRGQSDVVVY
jgi:hypothetical protein